MISLERGRYGRLHVCPRWPSSKVLVSPVALEKLQIVEAELPFEISLLLTRGYEPRASGLGLLRKHSRRVGIALFKIVYGNRRHEAEDIFGANGHDIDGTHLDVSLAVNGNRVRALPLSVFTPVFWQRRRVGKYAQHIEVVKRVLVRHGFRIHHNETESNQIHCDLDLTPVAVNCLQKQA